jgi:limonene-1,2-epoxide hydrolase
VSETARAVRAFLDAFNAEDLDALAEALSPTVEIQGRRGLVIGRAEAREWASRRPSGALRQRLVLEEVRDDGHPPVALVRRQWRWEDSDEVADEEEIAALVVLDREGLIARWQPFDDRAQAFQAAGLDP